MKKIILLTFLFFSQMSFSQNLKTDISGTIIALEKAALEKWNSGDPGGYINLSADDVSYFDPSLSQRLDGIENLKKYYEPIKKAVEVHKYEMINPQVVAMQNMAVLTFNFHSYKAEGVSKWNCTEVYRLEADGQWKIIHTHWSFCVKP